MCCCSSECAVSLRHSRSTTFITRSGPSVHINCMTVWLTHIVRAMKTIVIATHIYKMYTPKIWYHATTSLIVSKRVSEWVYLVLWLPGKCKCTMLLQLAYRWHHVWELNSFMVVAQFCHCHTFRRWKVFNYYFYWFSGRHTFAHINQCYLVRARAREPVHSPFNILWLFAMLDYFFLPEFSFVIRIFAE